MTRGNAWLHAVGLVANAVLTFAITFSFAATFSTLCLQYAWVVCRAINERWPHVGHIVRRELGLNGINR